MLEKIPFDIAPVHKYTLSNGCVFLHHRTKGMKGASLFAYFINGSRVETKLNQGVAHVVEHMLFRSSEFDHDYQNKSIVHQIEIAGGDLNAYTSKEYTQYEVGCLSRKMPQVFPLFVKMLLAPSFKENELSKEKKVILQELKEDREDFETVAEEKCFEKALSFPLGHSIGGQFQTVKNLGPKAVKSFYRKYYTPDRMILSLACDGEPLPYQKQLEKIFKELGPMKKKRPLRPLLKKQWGRVNNFNTILKRKTEVSTLILSSKGVPLGSELKSAMAVLDHGLTDGMKSILFKILREDQGLVYGIGGSASSFVDNGLFDITLSCAPASLKKAEALVLNTFERVAREGFESSYLERIKDQIFDFYELGFDDIDDRNEHIIASEMYYGQVRALSDIKGRLMKVDNNQIKTIANEFLETGFSRTILTKA